MNADLQNPSSKSTKLSPTAILNPPYSISDLVFKIPQWITLKTI